MFDRYVYPGTNVLQNKAGITDPALLCQFERQATARRILELRRQGVTGDFSASHLKSIHRYIFQDVYDWAGEFRDIGIYKGLSDFAEPDRIGRDLQSLCDGVKRKRYFKPCSFHALADGLARTMAELNRIHPFREGNGRAQRIFVEQLALNAGYDLDFSKISENMMRNDSVAAAHGDVRSLRYDIAASMTRRPACAGRRRIPDTPFDYKQRESDGLEY